MSKKGIAVSVCALIGGYLIGKEEQRREEVMLDNFPHSGGEGWRSGFGKWDRCNRIKKKIWDFLKPYEEADLGSRYSSGSGDPFSTEGAPFGSGASFNDSPFGTPVGNTFRETEEGVEPMTFSTEGANTAFDYMKDSYYLSFEDYTPMAKAVRKSIVASLRTSDIVDKFTEAVKFLVAPYCHVDALSLTQRIVDEGIIRTLSNEVVKSTLDSAVESSIINYVSDSVKHAEDCMKNPFSFENLDDEDDSDFDEDALFDEEEDYLV